jgi:hypothetical protein
MTEFLVVDLFIKALTKVYDYSDLKGELHGFSVDWKETRKRRQVLKE